MRAALARTAVTALLTGSALAVTAPAHAAACPGTDGVTVVVQDGDSVTTECAPGDPDSATKALTSAGFSVQQVQSQPGVICTIEEKPSTSCARMPPADHYWSFYHAPAGGGWEYSKVSVADHDPEPGSSVAFRLGDGSKKPSKAPADPADPVDPADSPSSDPSTGTGSGSEETTAGSDSGDEDDELGPALTAAVGGGVLALLAGGALLVTRRRGL